MNEAASLPEIVEAVKRYGGVTRKSPVQWAGEALAGVSDFGRTVVGLGDDAAAIRSGDGHLLIAADAIMPSLVEKDPYWAGYCSVVVNVNDIYAMGGKPLAMVNTIAYDDEEMSRLILSGIREGCLKFRVPMVGGHTTPDVPTPSLSVAILGEAKRLLTSFDCEEGDSIVLAIDLDGQRHNGFLHWDTTSHKSSRQSLSRLEVLPRIAKRGLANAAKDVSNPGILGTIGMMLETSGKGAMLEVDTIPRPEGVDWIDWLRMYPGFGFVLSCGREHTEEVVQAFSEARTTAQVIGQVTADRQVFLRRGTDSELLFDFRREKITGVGKRE